jgi:acid phosphatase (class A)
MLIRYAAMALLLSALAAAPASAQPAPKLTYFDQVIDMTELIPPPPPIDSEAWKEDLAGVMEAQENRTDAQVRRALAQKVLTIYLFDEVLGPKFNARNLPVTEAFFQRMQGDARAVLVAAKNTIQRQRPIALSKQVLALGGTPRLPTGYPSGGTVFTTSTAILLAKMIPEKRFELHERNREYNMNRVMLGEHFPRDIRAGEISGTVITHALMGKPAFVRDLEAVRVELRQVLGYSAEPAEALGSLKKPN